MTPERGPGEVQEGPRRAPGEPQEKPWSPTGTRPEGKGQEDSTDLPQPAPSPTQEPQELALPELGKIRSLLVPEECKQVVQGQENKRDGYRLTQEYMQEEPSEANRPKHWIHTTRADFFFGFWILLNAATMCLETDLKVPAKGTSSRRMYDTCWLLVDTTFNLVFITEMMMRIRAERWRWPRSPWNVFDGALVIVGSFDTWILPLISSESNARLLTLARVFRLARLVRVLRMQAFHELALLVSGILSAIRAMIWGFLLLLLTIFICSLLLTRLVGKGWDENDPQQAFYEYTFGTLPRTAFTLFMFTMEFQPDVCQQTWNEGPWLTLFFIVYVALTNITLLGVVASVIVENILAASEKAKRETEEDQIRQLFRQIDQAKSGEVSRADFETQEAQRSLDASGISRDEAYELFTILDTDHTGTVTKREFTEGMQRLRAPPSSKHLFIIEQRVFAMERVVLQVARALHIDIELSPRGA